MTGTSAKGGSSPVAQEKAAGAGGDLLLARESFAKLAQAADPAMPLDRQTMRVTPIDAIDGLIGREDDWRALANQAIEPNIFYEPALLIPAARNLAGGKRLQFVLVEALDPGKPLAAPTLVGLFPLLRERTFRRLPLSAASMWAHPQCFLTAPLVHRLAVGSTLQAFFGWLKEKANSPSIFAWKLSPASGRLHLEFLDELRRQSLLYWPYEQYGRAAMAPATSAEMYIRNNLTGRKIKDLRRLERRLNETGGLTFTIARAPAEADAFINAFLELEASGWKGRAQSALAQGDSNRAFFREAINAAAREGKFQGLALCLAGKPIAMKANFFTQGVGFAFKIAFDEAHAQSSPGVLLELRNIDEFHREPTNQMMDSCAAPLHPMINHLWSERRPITSYLLAPGKGWLAEGVISLLALARWAKRRFRKHAED